MTRHYREWDEIVGVGRGFLVVEHPRRGTGWEVLRVMVKVGAVLVLVTVMAMIIASPLLPLLGNLIGSTVRIML